jgi:hypothetical protein
MSMLGVALLAGAAMTVINWVIFRSPLLDLPYWCLFYVGCAMMGTRLNSLRQQWPSVFFWIGVAILVSTVFLYPLGLGLPRLGVMTVIAIILFLIDLWWGGPGKRQRRRVAETVLKVRSALAWGIPARRPMPA